jgi:hypothetical protein
MKPPNSSVLRRTRRLTLRFTILIAVLWGITTSVPAYPTGTMSCSDIGDFAAAVVVGKENGQSLEEALEKVKKRTAGYPVERKNLTQIVRAIYTEAWAMHLSEEGARQSFTADCEAQAAVTEETPRKLSQSEATQRVKSLPAESLSDYDIEKALGADSPRYRQLKNEEQMYGKDSKTVRDTRAHIKYEITGNTDEYYRNILGTSYHPSVSEEDREELKKLQEEYKQLTQGDKTPTPTPSPKPKHKRDSRKRQTGPAGEPVYRSQPVSPGNSGKGGSSDWGTTWVLRNGRYEQVPVYYGVYRRKEQIGLEQEQRGEDNITPEQRELWRRMDRPFGTPWRSFSTEDEHGYPNN